MADKEKKPKAGGDEPKPEKAAKGEKPAKEHAEKPAKEHAEKAPKAEKHEGEAKAEKPAKAPKAPKAEHAEGEAPAEAKAEKHAKAEKGEKAEKAPKGEKPGKGEKAPKGEKAEKPEGEPKGEKKPKEPEPPPPPARLFERYKAEIRPALKQKLGYTNDMAVPKLTKIVVSMGVGAALQNPKRIEEAQKHLTQIAGQKAVVTKARLSIANFKLREGQAIGCKVTLRRARMYEFLDRLISIAMPRIRDFRGLSPKQFDGRGNYSLGLTEQVVFPEIDATRVEFTQGMNVAICTTARSDKEAFELLHGFGLPFRS